MGISLLIFNIDCEYIYGMKLKYFLEAVALVLRLERLDRWHLSWFGFITLSNPVFVRRVYAGVFQENQIKTASKRTCKKGPQ